MYLDFFQVTLLIFLFLVIAIRLILVEYEMRFWRRQAVDCATDYDFLANENTVIRHASSLCDVPKRKTKHQAGVKSLDASAGSDRMRGVVETAQKAGDRDDCELQDAILLRKKL